MLTEVGKILRKLRIESDMLLYQMALDLNVGAAYLSAVEHGKKAFPKKWIKKITELYNLDYKDVDKLETALYNDELEKTISKLFFSGKKANSKNEMLISFARKFDSLDEEQLKIINRILGENTKDED